MTNLSSIEYAIYIDKVLVPYNPTNLQFHLGERYDEEFGISDITPRLYGIPPVVETVSFDISIPLDKPEANNWANQALNRYLTREEAREEIKTNGLQLVDALRTKMVKRQPITFEVVRYQHTPVMANQMSFVELLTHDPTSSQRNANSFITSRHADRYMITGISFSETGGSGFVSVVNVTLRKYFTAQRLVGSMSSTFSHVGITMTFRPFNAERVGFSYPTRCYTNQCGLGLLYGLYDAESPDDASLRDTPHSDDGVEIHGNQYRAPANLPVEPAEKGWSDTLWSYYSKAKYAVGDIVGAVSGVVQTAYNYVSPFISTGARMYMAYQLGWPAMVASALGGVPYLSGSFPSIVQEYTQLGSTLGLLGKSVRYRVTPDWVSPRFFAGGDEAGRENDLKYTQLWWGMGWDSDKYRTYLTDVPLTQLPFEIGSTIPPISVT